MFVILKNLIQQNGKDESIQKQDDQVMSEMMVPFGKKIEQVLVDMEVVHGNDGRTEEIGKEEDQEKVLMIKMEIG